MEWIRKIVREVLSEEYKGGNLYGYHVTSKGNLESINKNGFNVGTRAMQGKGVYSFYTLEHALRYASKGEVREPAIVMFELTSSYSLIIINTEIAKEVLGSNYHLKDQVNDSYWKYGDGLEGFLEGAKTVYKEDLTMETLIEELDDIEVNNSESNQRRFWSYMMPKSDSDRLNLLHNGNYGIEYRINYGKLMYPLGYYEVNPQYGKVGDLIHFEKENLIPDTEEYADLRNEIGDMDINTLRKVLDAKRDKVRNNIEWDYLTKLLDQIRDLTL